MGDHAGNSPGKILDDLAALAARDLPDGYQISLVVERHSGFIDLSYDGGTIDYPSDHETIGESFADALAWAMDHPWGGPGS
jgi:hypothetical protein